MYVYKTAAAPEERGLCELGLESSRRAGSGGRDGVLGDRALSVGHRGLFSWSLSSVRGRMKVARRPECILGCGRMWSEMFTLCSLCGLPWGRPGLVREFIVIARLLLLVCECGRGSACVHVGASVVLAGCAAGWGAVAQRRNALARGRV